MTAVPSGYVRSVLGGRDPVLDEVLRTSLLDRRMPTIQVDDNAGRVLQLLVALHRPEHVVEIGTLFGYSAIFLARGLPDGGRLTTVEIDPDAAELARRNLRIAGVADRVDVVVADAEDYLGTLPAESIGMFFIDGDKRAYPTYLARCFGLLRRGGLLVADDAYASGDYSPDHGHDGSAAADRHGIETYARAVGRSPRLFSAFVGTETGLLVSRKA